MFFLFSPVGFMPHMVNMEVLRCFVRYPVVYLRISVNRKMFTLFISLALFDAGVQK